MRKKKRLFEEWTGKDEKCLSYVLEGFFGKKVSKINDKDWERALRQALPYVEEGDTKTFSREWGARIQSLVEEYHEEVLGQLRLFE